MLLRRLLLGTAPRPPGRGGLASRRPRPGFWPFDTLDHGIFHKRLISWEDERESVPLLHEQVDLTDPLLEGGEDRSVGGLHRQKNPILFSHLPFDVSFDDFPFCAKEFGRVLAGGGGGERRGSPPPA